MFNTDQVVTHIVRYMNEEGASQSEAQEKALRTLNIEEMTNEQQEAVQEGLKAHEEAVQNKEEEKDDRLNNVTQTLRPNQLEVEQEQEEE